MKIQRLRTIDFYSWLVRQVVDKQMTLLDVREVLQTDYDYWFNGFYKKLSQIRENKKQIDQQIIKYQSSINKFSKDLSSTKIELELAKSKADNAYNLLETTFKEGQQWVNELDNLKKKYPNYSNKESQEYKLNKIEIDKTLQNIQNGMLQWANKGIDISDITKSLGQYRDEIYKKYYSLDKTIKDLNNKLNQLKPQSEQYFLFGILWQNIMQ